MIEFLPLDPPKLSFALVVVERNEVLLQSVELKCLLHAHNNLVLLLLDLVVVVLALDLVLTLQLDCLGSDYMKSMLLPDVHCFGLLVLQKELEVSAQYFLLLAEGLALPVELSDGVEAYLPSVFVHQLSNALGVPLFNNYDILPLHKHVFLYGDSEVFIFVPYYFVDDIHAFLSCNGLFFFDG